MKKLVLLICCIVNIILSFSLQGMKRTAEVEGEELWDVFKKELDELSPESVEEAPPVILSHFKSLPSELKLQILDWVLTAQGRDNTTRLHKAVDNIHALMRTNKALNDYLRDEWVVDYIITTLAKRYAQGQGNMIVAALALGTPEAGKWLRSHMEKEYRQKEDYVKVLGAIAQQLAQEEKINSFKFLLKYAVPRGARVRFCSILLFNNFKRILKKETDFYELIVYTNVIRTLLLIPETALAINDKNREGETPLLLLLLGFARKRIDFDITLLLLMINAGADVNELGNLVGPDKKFVNISPLFLVINSKVPQVSATIHALVQAGADINKFITFTTKRADSSQTTTTNPLLLAIQSLDNLVDILLEEGADVNIIAPINAPIINTTPLMKAVWENKVEILKKLLTKDVSSSIDVISAIGMTALMLAVQKGSLEMVHLLAPKASVNLENNNGQTALSLARQQGNKEIIEALQYYGAVR